MVMVAKGLMASPMSAVLGEDALPVTEDINQRKP